MMTAFNFRSLLLAAIVLSNCITWTASRHHFTHNVHQHRTRHRRQGAGLYLSASYVIPGGEGSGAWGEWGEVSPCSRTCGGGVASQKRICLQLGPDGQPECTGGDTKYFSCQTQDCPPGSQDFRAQQCAEFDDKEFRGYKYNWVPYTKAPKACELNCMPHGERFYFRHKAKVIDGTRCNDESFDVCVDGTCQPVGCDMMLGSNAREDKCRECRGNGANCRTTSGIFDSQDLMKGYNDILLIPEGSTTIIIEEVEPSNNYLALRAKNGTYYLNGHYHIDFPRSIMIAGALWYYERSQQGYAAPDKLRCLGPTNEPLYLSLLLQDENVGIKYEYSVPKSSAPPTDKRYNWVHEDFAPCSATCGGGFQTRNVTCRSREELEVVDDSLCDEGLKPPTNQTCNTDPCPAQWVEGPWGECSKRCGSGGVRSREVTCQKIIANGYASIVADKECFDLLGPKPELYQECNKDAPCPTWFIGHWKPCDKLCDEGKQTRQVVCYQKNNGRIEVLEDEECTEKKPEVEQPCLLQLCEGVDWVTSEWAGCDTCLSKVRTRVVMCATKDRRVVNDSFCANHPRPVDQQECGEIIPCKVSWYATQWSKCSVECGEGVQTRKVFCGLFDGDKVTIVNDTECADMPKYNETKPCEVPKEECPSQWYAGPWSSCTKECDGGEQYRRVMCLRGDKEASDCDGATIFDPTQACNTQPCDPDEILPVDSKSTPIMYDEDCEYDTDYPEVGLDEDLSKTTLDMMMSDSPGTGYAELESTLSSDSFSGDGSTLTTEELLSTEGSGFSTLETDTTESSFSTDNGSTITDFDETTTATPDKLKTEKTTVTLPKAPTTTPSGETDTTSSDTDTTETDTSDTSATEETGSTESTLSTAANETESTESDSTDTITDGSTEASGSTEAIETTVSGSTEESGPTVSTVTEESGPTESTVTEESGATESTVTEESSPSGSTDVKETGPTESTVSGSTEESGPTESTVIEESGPTESTVTEESGPTESTITEETSPSESTITEETSSTESTVTEETESTPTSDTSSTDTEETSSGSTEETVLTTESGATDTEETTGSDLSTESTTTTDKDKTTKVTVSLPTEGTTEGTAESSSEMSESSTSSESGTTVSSSEGSESTTVSSSESDLSTESSAGSESTSESGSTEATTTAGSESTTEAIESTSSGSTESSESTGVSEAEPTESSISSESTTEGSTEMSTVSETSESTEESSTTESGSTAETGSTEATTSGYSTTEAGSTSETTEVSGSTTEGLTTTEGSTIEGLSTTEGVTVSTGKSTWEIPITTKKRPAFCKPRRKIKCDKTEFGCCPDKRTAAAGPFDEGCPKPRTCKESLYGCCPDGLSPARGENNEGCPVEPCADTLFGCCRSDNKTAAQGNDDEGCPPPPPPCMASKHGCCADNETEATGPEKEGCPETETTTTAETTETTPESTDTTESSGSTASEGSTEVTSSTTLFSCEDSEFGCCFDNETAAAGPQGQGCPCNATEFGCCPDGVSPAQGVDNAGCPGPCSTSQHGCCQDGQTPAHGPDFEGCCLLSSFGCCPDNRKPAEGPHLEGCGCQHTQHGCCPDNITIAQGPDNKGCGCQYTEHGCCPDRHTEASGPNYEGCPCNTYQFGCCDDGVTIAIGPDHQGCNCRDSAYGCCSDGVTAATGPDAAGCDCSSSRYGCCPDGQTEASGPKFLGCTDVPENKQAVCTMATDPGECSNFTAMWFYDLEYGGCSRFWYGGCGGNGNRFATKEDCEDVCVQPAPKDACKLPGVKGVCDGDHVRWYFNTTMEQCIPFRYGGCLGNANNFDNQELCQKQCEPERSADQCSLPIEQGSCAGNFSRWGYVKETQSCQLFIWGGCEGNTNRFSTEAACLMRCNPPGAPKPQCSQPQETGKCDQKEALWSFSQTENRCVPFYYTGCEGNDNRFSSREDCEQACPSAYVPDKCTLPAEVGACSNYRQNWFFDTSINRCRMFYYGGCGGNENNFPTEAECKSACAEITTTTTTTTTARPEEPPRPQPPTDVERPEFCFLPTDPGPCTKMETRYAYDSDLGKCKSFEYGGCGGNQNNFPNEEYCTYYCHPVQDICQLPMVAGPCDESIMRWFYDASTDSCSQFTYGGCQGNDNRFESREACESRCRTSPSVEQPATNKTTPVIDSRLSEAIPPECRVTAELEECEYGGEVWYYEERRRECVPHSNQDSGAGAVCRHSGAHQSQEACERACGAFRGIDVCKQAVDAGSCQNYVTKVYFDAAIGQCREFIYGGCHGGANRFSSMEECNQVCRNEIDPCSLPPEAGNCVAYIEQWYYDTSRDQCNKFVYTGCSGNDNRFETQSDCESRCKRPAIATTTTTVAPAVPPQEEAQECITPRSLAPCGSNVTVFYYDSERRECLAGDIGACGHPNSYNSEEECERRCGNFRGQDVCGARLDPGPCRASIPKFYWDAVTGSCQPFAYGGCNGGPNRFSTAEECENICGDSGPAPECLEEVDTGRWCESPAGPRYYYSVVQADCVVFTYQGCGGNHNNFRTYQQCTSFNEIPGADCDALRQECDRLGGGLCPYGITRTVEDGCQRCTCAEDPCVLANCGAGERCVAVAFRDPTTQEPQYSARCVPEQTNEVSPDCDEYNTECHNLRCEYGIQRTRLPNGCERCSCINVQIDCAPLQKECEELKCQYGMERRIDQTDGCERCRCKPHPCTGVKCAAGERCVVSKHKVVLDQETRYSGDCRTVEKPGMCPINLEDTYENEVVPCRQECVDDADCRGVGKCCQRGCSKVCVIPADTTTPHLITTTYAPDVSAPPQVVHQEEPEVTASEGGKATLRCLFHGNPPPKITWRWGELTIDGNVGRYRLMSDGALEIVSLYRNDTGVYICVADNGLGVATQEINLVVNDPVKTPVGIAGDENAVVTGELGKPLVVRCLAYGYPAPAVFWYRSQDGTMVPYNDAVYEARDNVLLIRSLTVDTLGEYTCQAYNGEGKAASWTVGVRAYRPEGIFVEHEFLVPRFTVAPMAKTRPPTTKETTTTTTETTTRTPRPLFTVPVSTHVSTPYSTLDMGADLQLMCEVDGFPDPDVYWTKDGARIMTNDRVSVAGTTVSRLTVSRVTLSDAGVYTCHASNAYTSHSDSAQINIQQHVPAKCTDNPFFANCDLIVRSKFCRHKYYSKFCCKSCVEAGQLDAQEAELQADQPFRRK